VDLSMLSQLPLTAAIALLANQLNHHADIDTSRFKCQYCNKAFARGYVAHAVLLHTWTNTTPNPKRRMPQTYIELRPKGSGAKLARVSTWPETSRLRGMLPEQSLVRQSNALLSLCVSWTDVSVSRYFRSWRLGSQLRLLQVGVEQSKRYPSCRCQLGLLEGYRKS
jgi:hypothetical protein